MLLVDSRQNSCDRYTRSIHFRWCLSVDPDVYQNTGIISHGKVSSPWKFNQPSTNAKRSVLLPLVSSKIHNLSNRDYILLVRSRMFFCEEQVLRAVDRICLLLNVIQGVVQWTTVRIPCIVRLLLTSGDYLTLTIAGHRILVTIHLHVR